MVAGTMDYLIAHSLRQLKAEGYAEASLANDFSGQSISAEHDWIKASHFY